MLLEILRTAPDILTFSSLGRSARAATCSSLGCLRSRSIPYSVRQLNSTYLVWEKYILIASSCLFQSLWVWDSLPVLDTPYSDPARAFPRTDCAFFMYTGPTVGSKSQPTWILIKIHRQLLWNKQHNDTQTGCRIIFSQMMCVAHASGPPTDNNSNTMQ